MKYIKFCDAKPLHPITSAVNNIADVLRTKVLSMTRFYCTRILDSDNTGTVATQGGVLAPHTQIHSEMQELAVLTLAGGYSRRPCVYTLIASWSNRTVYLGFYSNNLQCIACTLQQFLFQASITHPDN